MKNLSLPSPIEQLNCTFLERKKIHLFVKRDDLIHEVISGNKWRKLKLNVNKALKQNKHTLLTFGGAFSNHLIATAFAAKANGLQSIGVVRGNEFKVLNETLSKCQDFGMRLIYFSREEYRNKYSKKMLCNFDLEGCYLVPEGGANKLGVEGCKEIVKELDTNFDYLCCSAGTGTTAAGIFSALTQEKLVVFPAIKGEGSLKDDILKWSGRQRNCESLKFVTDYHFKGYAKVNQELVDFVNEFYRRFNIKLDLIYTAKLFYGLFDLIKKDFFPEGSKLLAVHSGGLQGNHGFVKRKGITLFDS